MDALRPEFACDALRHVAHRSLGGGERRETRLAAQTARRAGEDQAAAPALQQSRQRRLRNVEATERVLAPVALEAVGADLQEWARNVAAGVVHGDRKRRQVLRRRHEHLRIFRRRSVADSGQGLRPRCSQFRGHGFDLVGAASGDGHRVAARGEPTGDRRPQALRCADAHHQHAALPGAPTISHALLQKRSSPQQWREARPPTIEIK